MSTAPLEVAIIGAGIGREHLRAYLQLPDLFRVTCVCDIDTNRAEEVAALEGVEPETIRISDSFDEVISDSTYDLIDICLPPHLHFPMSIAALEAGKHVICEKPLVSSLHEADELIKAEEKSHRKIFPVFQYRYGPEIGKLKALIKHGIAGKPLVASIETHWNRNSDYYANPWRGTWKGEQGGAVLGHAIHNHDLLCAIFGPVKRLSAFGDTRVNSIETEDCAAISFQMENGALATSSITLGAFTDTTRLRFCFENLTAESDLLPYAPADGNWMFDARGTKFCQQEIDDFLKTIEDCNSGFKGYLEAVAKAVRCNDGHEAVTLDDGRRSIELVTAIYASMRSGKSVELPLATNHPLYESWLP